MRGRIHSQKAEGYNIREIVRSPDREIDTSLLPPLALTPSRSHVSSDLRLSAAVPTSEARNKTLQFYRSMQHLLIQYWIRRWGHGEENDVNV